jgi:D-alanyl-D-alanine carboxypeptidase
VIRGKDLFGPGRKGAASDAPALRGRFGSSPARGRVRAKTGYIRHVVALSGYVPRPDASRPPLVFSILLNNFVCSTGQAKAAVDKFVGVLTRRAGWTGPKSGRPKR